MGLQIKMRTGPMRKKTLEDYLALAKELDLEFIGKLKPGFVAGEVPDDITQPAKWLCLRCGREPKHSFTHLKHGYSACRCRDPKSLAKQDFFNVANEWGIVWVEEKFVPQTSKQVTNWRNPITGEIFSASYRDLKYRTPSELKRFLPERNREELAG